MSDLNRRQFLASAGATAVAGVLAGCPGTDPEDDERTEVETATGTEARTDSGDSTVTRHGIAFDTVVDGVRDLSMDPDGKRPIDEQLSSFLDRERTLLRLPPGTYTFSGLSQAQRVNRLGIVGAGENPGDVVFRTPSTEGTKFIDIRSGGTGFLLENVRFDHEGGDGTIGNTLRLDDKLQIHNIEHVGFNPSEGNGAVDNLSPQILSPNGRAVVEGFVRTGPTNIVSHGHLNGNGNAGCIWLGGDHEGELVIRNAHIENTGTNAVYASRVPGNIVVENCRFVNNNQASLRIGGEGSVVRNTQFVVDTENDHPKNVGDYINPNGIVWETGKLGETGGLIEGCSFEYHSAPEETTAALWADGSAGAFTVKNTTFDIDVPSVTAIRVDDPADPRLGVTAAKPWGVTLSNVAIDGPDDSDRPVIDITGRPDSVIENICVSTPNSRGAINVTGSKESSITGIDVGSDGCGPLD